MNAELAKYRKKPVVIDAIQYLPTYPDTPGIHGNRDVVIAWCSPRHTGIDDDGCKYETLGLFIETLEGEMQIKPLDYVIKGIQGEFYPCKPDIFEASYEPHED